MPFAPIFIDLVRNYTTTTGTGNLVLGDPAPGFRSFASALKAGDSFYYSVLGLDNVAESEVGRGTLVADGTIARDPISGVPTNFSKGMKSVSLVTAAEWFQGAANKGELDAATQFSVGAPGSVPRPLLAKVADVVSVRDFGASGNGVADDTPAMAAAVAHAAASGQALFVPKGTYMVSPAALVVTGSGHAERFVLFGEGATSVIKVKDGANDGASNSLIEFRTSQDMDLIEFRDLVLDMNARGSTDPLKATGNAWAYQHSHTIRIDPSSGTIEHVRCSNVVIRDPVADGFNISAAASDATPVVKNFSVINCAVVDRTRLRSDICLVHLPLSTVIDGFYGDVIEMEPVKGTPTPVKMQLSNCHVNRLDITSHAADWATGNVEVYLDTVTAPERVDFYGVMLRASNCTFGITNEDLYRRWYCLQAGSQISDTLFLHKYYPATNSIGQLQPMSTAEYSWRSSLRLIGCESRIDSSEPSIQPTLAAIAPIAGVTPAAIDNAYLEIVNHKFDKRLEASVFANQCGQVRLAGNSYGGWRAAIKYQPGASTAVDLSVEGGDFRRVRGASIGTAMATVDQSAGIGYLRLSGDHVGVATPWAAISAGLSSSHSNQLFSNRRMLMAAVPSGGIPGDIVELRSPTAGAADSYRCTSGGPSATWKARTSLAG